MRSCFPADRRQILRSETKIALIGGDARQTVTASHLCDVGFEVAGFGFGGWGGDMSGITRCTDLESALRGARAVIAPLPITRDTETLYCPLGSEREQSVSLDGFISSLGEGCVLIGGNLPDRVVSTAEARGVRVRDYFRLEEIGVLNAVPTAEGAIAIAMRELPITVCGAEIHIIGFGRIGKVLSRTAAAMGARVTVWARRNSDLAWIRVFGYESRDLSRLSEEENPFGGASAVFNTAPKQLITREVLGRTDTGVLIIDLASAPGGVDRAAAEERGIRVIWALALPGKTAPVSSGRIISEGIFGILQAEGITP